MRIVKVRYPRKTSQNMLVLTLVFLRFAYLPRRFREILLLYIFPAEQKELKRGSVFYERTNVPVVSDGKHARLRHHVPQICSVEPV